MPRKPKRPCRYPGCPNLCDTGAFCEKHRKECSPESLRGSAVARGYDARWRQARRQFLQQNPLCQCCLGAGRFTAATVVDHLIPHRGDPYLFWDPENWQALCKKCHDEKTGRGL